MKILLSLANKQIQENMEAGKEAEITAEERTALAETIQIAASKIQAICDEHSVELIASTVIEHNQVTNRVLIVHKKKISDGTHGK